MMNPNKDVLLPNMKSRSYTRLDFFKALAEGNHQIVDSPLSEVWNGSLLGNPALTPLCNAAALNAPIWRSSSQTNNKMYTYYNSAPEEPLSIPEMEDFGLPRTAIATPQGTISLRLSHSMRVDLTIDRAIRLINFKSNIVIAMNPTGSACALFHPNGRVHQNGSRVDIMANDLRGGCNKFAKMWYKGVSFTSDNCALVYLVDSAGTRTTTDTFADLGCDISVGVFYTESRHGQMHIPSAVNLIQSSQYNTAEDGTENWNINNVKISQGPDGLVRVVRNNNKYQVRTSPSNGTASITTPFLHCTASLGNSSHLFVRRGERRMHFDGHTFIVRNAGHSAGFDEKTQLKVY